MKAIGRSQGANSGARYTLFGQWGKFLVQALNLVLLSRLLTPSEFGAYSMVIAVTGLAGLLGDFGLSSASIQAERISDQQKSNLFWINVAVGVLLAAGMILGAPLIASFFGDDRLISLVVWLGGAAFVQSISTQFLANFSRERRFADLAVIDVVPQALGCVIAILAALAGVGVWSLVAQQVVIAAVTVVLAICGSRWRPKLPRRAPMRALLSFGANTFGVQLVNYLTSNLGSVLIGKSLGASAAGQFSKAQQLYRFPTQQIATPLTRVALPMLSRLQRDPERLSASLGRALNMLCYLVVGALLFLAGTADVSVKVLMGSQWGEVAAPFAVLCLGGCFEVVGTVYYWAFLSTGRTDVQLRYAIVTRSLMLGLIVLGSGHGILGVATGYSSGLLVNFLVLTFAGLPKTGLSIRSMLAGLHRPVAVNVVAFFVVSVSRRLLTGSGPGVVLASCMVVWVLVVAMGALLWPGVKRDLACLLRTAANRG